MLVLTRRTGESIVISGRITLTVNRIAGSMSRPSRGYRYGADTRTLVRRDHLSTVRSRTASLKHVIK